MNERAMQFRVGVMLFAAVLVAVVLAMTFGGLPSLFEKTYTLRVKFPSVSGLGVGAPVRKSGVRIGEVSHISLAPDDQVLVTLRIESKYPIHRDDVCRLRTGLLGDAWVEFEPAQTAGGGVANSIGQRSEN